MTIFAVYIVSIMDKEELIVRIKNAALALVHQAERLGETAPTRTDFEATLANVRSLYEYISILNYLQRYGTKTSVQAVVQQSQTDVGADTPSDTAPAATSASRPPTAPEEKKATDDPSNNVDKPPVVPAAMPEAPGEAVLADRLRLMPVDDLRKAISLADKFQYIYELFGGENNAYHAALDTLNTLHSKADAEAYLNELAGLYGWDSESDTTLRFRELISKRFAV